MDDIEFYKLALEYIDDLTVQLLTLSTGIITITITFIKNFLDYVQAKLIWIRLSWLFLLLNIFFGILTKMAIAAHLSEKYKEIQPNLELLSGIQIVFFFLGIVSLIIFGAKRKKVN